MKRTAITVLAALAVLPLAAQSRVVNNPDNHPFFGVKVGLNLSCPGNYWYGPLKIDYYNPGAGFSLGGIFHLPIVANMYFEPGVDLFYNTYALKTQFAPEDLYILEIVGSNRKLGMDIPLHVGYHFDVAETVKLSVFTGPMFEYGFTGTQRAVAKLIGGEIVDSQSLYGGQVQMNRFDAMWDVGASVTIEHVAIGLTGSFGMCNMTKLEGLTFRENLVKLSLTYNI